MFDPQLLRVFMAWFMCSDPWPLGKTDEVLVKLFLTDQVRRHGYTDWITAYHSDLGRRT